MSGRTLNGKRKLEVISSGRQVRKIKVDKTAGTHFSLTQDNTILFERIPQRNITENHSRICGNHTIDTDILLSYNKAGNAIISHSESAIFASCHLNRETRTEEHRLHKIKRVCLAGRIGNLHFYLIIPEPVILVMYVSERK